MISEIVRLDGSPLVSLRLVLPSGAVNDPPGRPGLAALTAALLTQGGTQDQSYPEILDALFPMATSVNAQVDKEWTTFSAETHIDNLDAFYAIFRAMLLQPGWREEDFTRVQDDLVNGIRAGLRSSNDEELAKELLYEQIYRGHPYGSHTAGHVKSLEAFTLEDVKSFYNEYYHAHELILGVGGGCPESFVDRLRTDFRPLASAAPRERAIPPAPELPASFGYLVEKESRSVAISLGYPIDVRRGHPDYPALLVAQSYLGQHRMGGRLFDQIREARGLNYGNYAYLEYFPMGMYTFQPAPNLARQQQLFQIWIRPVEWDTAHFSIRLALRELQRLIDNGLSEEEFERTRLFLSKYVHLLTKTKSAELGYEIDSLIYGISDYASYVREGLASLTRDQLHQAIRRHLRTDRWQLVAVGPKMTELGERLMRDTASPIKYATPKPPEVLAEDRVVERYPVKVAEVEIVPVNTVLE